MFGSGEEIAHKIRLAVKEELGLSVSVGVSFNKVFAKLASDMKKPDAVTVISKSNYRRVVYPIPVTDLLLVGRSTAETLYKCGIRTIGDLAAADEELLVQKMGKRGRQVRIYARGEDDEPVKNIKEKEDLKSIGNSSTLPYDVKDGEEIKRWLYVLSESVAARIRDAGVGRANTVHIVVKDENLGEFTWQEKVYPTAVCGDIAKAGYELFCKHWKAGAPVHMLGVSVSGFDYNVSQITLDGVLGNDEKYRKKERVENAVADIRKRFGYEKLQRGIVFEDEKLSGLDIRGKKQEPPSERQVIDENEK